MKISQVIMEAHTETAYYKAVFHFGKQSNIITYKVCSVLKKQI